MKDSVKPRAERPGPKAKPPEHGVARIDMELPDGRYLLVYSKPEKPRA